MKKKIHLKNWYICAHPDYPLNSAPTCVIGKDEDLGEVSFFEEDIKEATGKTLIVRFESATEDTIVNLHRPLLAFARWAAETDQFRETPWDPWNPIKIGKVEEQEMTGPSDPEARRVWKALRHAENYGMGKERMAEYFKQEYPMKPTT